MRVFRVEDVEKLGPYRGSSKFYQRHKSRYEHRPHQYPTPFREGLWEVWGPPEGHVCGFSSIDKLRNWFAPAMKDLNAELYRVVEYEVPRRHVLVGKKQVTFMIDAAKPVTVWSWPEVYKRR